MKKVCDSFFVMVLLFLSACASNEDVDTATSESGDLIAKITFEQATPTRVEEGNNSTAIPVTSWSNVKQLQLFLYDATGKIAFSYIIDPATSSDKIFKWTNVPVGTYDLALVANVNSTSDNIATTWDGGATWTAFDAYNVRNKILNTDIFVDLKSGSFPGGHTFGITPEDKAYTPTSEIFTAYRKNVKIELGKETNLDGTPLSLVREVSLMRVRIDKTDKPASAPALSTVTFNSDTSFIAVHNMPVKMGFQAGTFTGGIFDTSDPNRILIGSTGTTTFKTENPLETDYSNPTTIIAGNYSLWNDILVWPNAMKADNMAPASDAVAARKYFIVIAAKAPAGYEYADGTIASVAKPVYWYGTINGVFSPNVIREVNINITSKGYPTNPTDPTQEGGLSIFVSAPEPWNSNIQSETIEL